MKKLLIITLTLFVAISCSDDYYDSLNRDPNNPSEVSAESLFNSSVVSLFDQMESTSVNLNVFRLFSQYWTETTYVDEANFDLNTRSIPDNHWRELYTDVLFDLSDSKQLVLEANEPGVQNKVAQITFLQAYTWQILVDTFGDIPFTEALKPTEFPSPAYDDAASVYGGILTMIDEALGSIEMNSSSFGEADVIYGGDMEMWKKFGNSLKLKVAMRLADVNPSVAGSAAASAVTGGVFTSNADNATIAYESATPNTNPLWEALVQSGRNDYIVANTFVDYMQPRAYTTNSDYDLDGDGEKDEVTYIEPGSVKMADPRAAVFFDQNVVLPELLEYKDTNDNVLISVDYSGDIANVGHVYVGGPYGDNNAFGAYTHIGAKMHEPTFRGVLLDYAEVEFNLAEAVEQGFSVGGTAESHYNAGITANMEDWGVDAADITAYLAEPDVAYSTAPGDWREKIGMQFWKAMYNRGFEGWYVYRKFDTPMFNLPLISGLPVPKRYTYPADEQSLNEANYSAASSKIGGDEQQTKIFWDIY